MTQSTLRIDVDLQDFYRALSVIEGPGPETVAALTAALAEAYVETQARVHVVTGSLLRSGRAVTDLSEDSWEGVISYGGPSPGSVHDPVTYAASELSRGGTHDDYFETLHLFYDEFERAMFASVEARL